MNIKKITALLCAVVMVLSLAACGSNGDKAENKHYTVGICQLVQHDALDAATKGFRDAITDALGADFMERWYRTQCARTLETPRHLPEAAASTPPPPTADPWERAIAQARAEIRALIESGDLDHDEITTGWIETWAAEIYADAA